MIKRVVLNIVSSKLFAQLFLDLFLKIDNYIYKLITLMSVAIGNGRHPKKDILKYENWFINQVSKNDRVLDVGCNTGELLRHMAKDIEFGLGVEIIDKHVAVANKKNKFENIKYINEDATTTDLTKFGKFHYVTLSNVLEHIEHRVEFLKKLVVSVQNDDCVFLIRVPLITRDWVPCFKKSRGIDYRLDNTHYTEYVEDELLGEVKEAGLIVKEIDKKFGECFLRCEIAKS